MLDAGLWLDTNSGLLHGELGYGEGPPYERCIPRDTGLVFQEETFFQEVQLSVSWDVWNLVTCDYNCVPSRVQVVQ